MPADIFATFMKNIETRIASIKIPSIALLFPDEFVPIKVVKLSRFNSAFSKLKNFQK